jgi:Tfp pilus assembly PilM family ATPase
VSFEPFRIRAVQVRGSQGSGTQTRASQIALPEGSIVHGSIIDRSAVTAALRKLWKQGGFTTRNVVFSVDGVAITTNDLVDLDQDDGRTNGLAILIASETLIDARLRPLATEAIPTALIRSAHEHCNPQETIAVVEIGSDVVTVAIARDSQLLFTKNFANQGTEIASLTVQSAFGITYQEASNRIQQLKDDGDTSIEWKRRTREIVDTWTRSVASLVMDCLDQFSHEHQGSPISSIALTGYGNSISGVTRYFDSIVEYQVISLDTYALPHALARTRSEGGAGQRTNLLPAIVREAVIVLGVKRWLIACFVVLGIASLALWSYQQPQLNDLNHQVQILRGDG